MATKRVKGYSVSKTMRIELMEDGGPSSLLEERRLGGHAAHRNEPSSQTSYCGEGREAVRYTCH